MAAPRGLAGGWGDEDIAPTPLSAMKCINTIRDNTQGRFRAKRLASSAPLLRLFRKD